VARLLLEGGADIKAKNDVRALAFALLRTRCCARLRAWGAAAAAALRAAARSQQLLTQRLLPFAPPNPTLRNAHSRSLPLTERQDGAGPGHE
jgi:hypothetical protein